jgi:hypothetical protein
MAKAARPREPAPRAKRRAPSDRSSIDVQPGDVLVSLDEKTNFLFQTKTRAFREISAVQLKHVTQHYADTRMATKRRAIIVVLACRGIDDPDKARRRRSR